jgi:hypothetical protein
MTSLVWRLKRLKGRNAFGRTSLAGLLARQCVLRNTLAGSKSVVFISRDATVYLTWERDKK